MVLRSILRLCKLRLLLENTEHYVNLAPLQIAADQAASIDRLGGEATTASLAV